MGGRRLAGRDGPVQPRRPGRGDGRHVDIVPVDVVAHVDAATHRDEREPVERVVGAQADDARRQVVDRALDGPERRPARAAPRRPPRRRRRGRSRRGGSPSPPAGRRCPAGSARRWPRAGRGRIGRTRASWWMYIGSPSASASYSDSQSSPRNPLCTKRTVVVPDRPSRVNSIACTTPSGPGVPSSTK